MQAFDKQHAVRSFFDDPRAEGAGASSFHFGIDIAAPDGTPVYRLQVAVYDLPGNSARAGLWITVANG